MLWLILIFIVNRWKNSDIQMISRCPSKKKGRKYKLSATVELKIITWAKTRNESWESCTGILIYSCYYYLNSFVIIGDKIIAHAKEVHGVELSKRFVSYFMRHHRYCSCKTQVWIVVLILLIVLIWFTMYTRKNSD